MSNERRARILITEPSITYDVDAPINTDIDLDLALDGLLENIQLLGNPKATHAMFQFWIEPPPHTQDGYEITDLDEHEDNQ